MEILRVSLFFAVTFGHFLLTPYWFKRLWGPSVRSGEEFCFQAFVFAFGSLQAVLHGLACTVGIGLAAGLMALVALHLSLYAWVRRVSAPAAADRADAEAGTEGVRRWWAVPPHLPLLTLLGVTAVACCVVSWLARSAQSMQILGIDSFHYHVPFAVNYAHGSNLFGYLATPHLYPVGASILDAWFFQPFANPLLLDLVNLLPFLLLLVSYVYLFRLLTGESGWEWAPIVFLLLFTGKMFRISLFISADMLYAASFAAVFTQLCGIWIEGAAGTRDWLSLAVAMGLLFSSKIQGFMSGTLLIASFVAATVALAVLRPAQRLRIAWSVNTCVAAVVSLLACGGIWLIRNYLYFGSPMAPAGLTLFGIPIFSGGSPYNDWLSIAKDMRDIPGYNLPARFLARSREWAGVWPAFVSLGFVALLVDVAYQLIAQRHLANITKGKLFALGLFIALFAVHAYVLIYTSGTSIEILYGQTVRYIIPFYALFPLLAYVGFFSDALPWVRMLHLKWVLLPGLAYLLYHYNAATQMPIEWNQAHGGEDLVDNRLLVLAFLAVAPWCLHLEGAAGRYARYASAAVVTLWFVAFVRFCVTQNAQLTAAARASFEGEISRFQRLGATAGPYRGVFLRVLDYQRRQGQACERSRFFMMTRFDYPLTLQDPQFTNLVFDVQDDSTRIPWLLKSDGPGASACDYIVAAYREGDLGGGTKLPPVSEIDISRLLKPRGALEVVGDSSIYRVYHVRHG